MSVLYKGITIQQDDKIISTSGLRNRLNDEITLLCLKRNFDEYSNVIMNIIDYLLLSKKMIDDQETFAYNSWLLKFIKSSAGFSLYEATPNGDGFNNGVDYGVVITSDQNHECKKLKIAPLFPTFSQDIVISKGIYEGLPVNAVRYPSPGHMTGWWLTTDLYDGKIESLMNVHFYHVAFKRPDILRFLALPHGFRFYSDTNSQEVWFDPTVLNEN